MKLFLWNWYFFPHHSKINRCQGWLQFCVDLDDRTNRPPFPFGTAPFSSNHSPSTCPSFFFFSWFPFQFVYSAKALIQHFAFLIIFITSYNFFFWRSHSLKSLQKKFTFPLRARRPTYICPKCLKSWAISPYCKVSFGIIRQREGNLILRPNTGSKAL